MAAELSAYDEQERERIRTALKRYKELHGIGDVKLRKQIETAVKLSVQLKTLQRFLAGKHRTDDVPVHRFRLFLQKVAPPPPADELAKAFSRFLPLSIGLAWKGGMGALAGTYRAATRPYEGGKVIPMPRIRSQSASIEGFRTSCARFTLTKSGNPGFLRVTQFDMAPKEGEEQPLEELAPFGSAGFLMPFGKSEAVMMTRGYYEASLFMLKRIVTDPNVLRGYAFNSEGAFSFARDETKEAWKPSYEIILIKAE